MTLEKSIGFDYTARYFDNGTPVENTKAIWFVFHGYGQLASFFLRKFAPLSALQIRVIAPEGLSRYYLKDSSGRVGASWMTKEDRLVDIKNYTQYLNTIYREVISEYTSVPVTHVLGFSQGAATACRWTLSQDFSFQSLILWAGLFPPDLDFHLGKERLINRSAHFVYGKNDPYLNDKRFKEMEELSLLLDVSPTIWTFNGSHNIDSEMLEKLAKGLKY